MGKGRLLWKLTLREREAEVLKAPRALRAEDKVWLVLPARSRAQAVGRLAGFPPQPSFPHRELARDSAARTVQGGGGLAGHQDCQRPQKTPLALRARRSQEGAWRRRPGPKFHLTEEKMET